MSRQQSHKNMYYAWFKDKGWSPLPRKYTHQSLEDPGWEFIHEYLADPAPPPRKTMTTPKEIGKMPNPINGKDTGKISTFLMATTTYK